MRPLLQQKIESRVEKIDRGCWLWQGAITDQGYGNMWVDGRNMGAHIASYEAFVSLVPSGLCVLHKCDIKRCVNPNHLYVGTYSDNMRDTLARVNVQHFNSYKTHCKRGHPLIGDNLYPTKSGWRRCKICTKLLRKAES